MGKLLIKTGYIVQCISITDITHLDRLGVTIRVLLCILKGFLLSLGISFLWASFLSLDIVLWGCYKNMCIIAVLFFNIFLFCLKVYSENLTDCTSSATSNTTVAIHVFVHLDISKTKYRFWSETEGKLLSRYPKQISLRRAFERTLS